MALAAALAVSMAGWLTVEPGWVWGAALTSLLLLVLNIFLWRRNPVTGVQAAFPCVAVGAAMLGVGWTAALIG
jgi:hypothetical protein